MSEFLLTTKEELRALVQDILDQRPLLQPIKEDEILTRQQVAAMLKVSLVTVDSYVKLGKLPAFRIGRKVRFKKSQIEESMKKIQL